MSGQEAKSKRSALLMAVALAAVLVVAGVAYAFVSGNVAPEGAEIKSGQAMGQNSSWNNPAMYSLEMSDSEGEPVVLGAVADGQVTVVNIWATWCPYCLDEMLDYQELYDQYGDCVQFVMLDCAETSDEVHAAASYIEQHDFSFPVYYDVQGELREYFKVYAYPTTVVIAADGELLNNAPGRINKQGMDDALSGLV